MGALFGKKNVNPNQAIIKCSVEKYQLLFDKTIPARFRNRIDAKTWKECVQHILDGIASMNTFELKQKGKICGQCAIICILVFCSCFPSSIISFHSGVTYNYRPYYFASLILFALSIISTLLFVKYSNDKINYDNLWRIKIYNGINTRFNYLNNHMVLKDYMSFKLTKTLSSNQSCNCFECGATIAKQSCCFCYKASQKDMTSKHPTISVRLKGHRFISLPCGTIYQFNNVNINSVSKQKQKQKRQKSQNYNNNNYPVQINQSVNIYNQRLLNNNNDINRNSNANYNTSNNYNNYVIPVPSAPMQQPINDNNGPAAYPFNPELLREDNEGR